jgi:hypothetical protein
MQDNIIELMVDDKVERFEILLRFRFKGNDYIALNPESEDEESVAIFTIDKAEDDAEVYCTITDENLAKEVFVHFVSLWELMDEDEEE